MVDPKEQQHFLQREYSLLGRVQGSGMHFGCDHARRHMREGFARRLLLMQTSRLAMIEIAPLDRKEKLSTYECADLNVHVNSWYVQLRGALDNLSWALQYRWQLLGDGDEDDPKVRRLCYLFGKECVQVMGQTLPRLQQVVSSYSAWAKDFKELRDPIAHRVPMYAVPAVAFDDEKRQFERLSSEANQAAESGDFDTFRTKMQEAQDVGTYYHVVAMSGSGGIELRRLPPQLAQDFNAFLAISEAVVEEFETAA
jgi:hypothetical protein